MWTWIQLAQLFSEGGRGRFSPAKWTKEYHYCAGGESVDVDASMWYTPCMSGNRVEIIIFL